MFSAPVGFLAIVANSPAPGLLEFVEMLYTCFWQNTIPTQKNRRLKGMKRRFGAVQGLAGTKVGCKLDCSSPQKLEKESSQGCGQKNKD